MEGSAVKTSLSWRFDVLVVFVFSAMVDAGFGFGFGEANSSGGW